MEEEKDIEETFPEEEKEVRREMEDRICVRVEKYQERDYARIKDQNVISRTRMKRTNNICNDHI